MRKNSKLMDTFYNKVYEEINTTLENNYDDKMLETFIAFKKEVQHWNDKFGKILHIEPLWSSNINYDVTVSDKKEQPKLTLLDKIGNCIDRLDYFFYHVYSRLFVGKSLHELEKMENSLFEQVWFYRELIRLHNDDESLGAGPFRELELAKKYPELLKGLTDFELGELNGKLYMIRWVLSSKVLDDDSLYET